MFTFYTDNQRPTTKGKYPFDRILNVSLLEITRHASFRYKKKQNKKNLNKKQLINTTTTAADH